MVPNNRARALTASLVAFAFIACANQPCRQIKRPDLADMTKPSEKPSAPAVAPTEKGGSTVTTATSDQKTIFVYKPDGSLQCQNKKGVAVEEMEKELAGIRVISKDKRPDGLMHIQVCGSPTGMINVYEIPVEKLKEAESRGFKKWER
jgi:hypothetical protein